MKRILLALLLLPALAQATAEGAKAAYMRGTAKEKAKDYKGAVQEYEAALAEYPGYVYANKQLGTCWYYLGDKAKAVENYDLYLAKVPNDASIKKFADGLRAQLPAGEAAAPSKKKAEKKAGSGPNDAFYMGFGFGYLMNSGDDIKSLYGSSGGYSFGLGFGGGYDLHAGYQMSNGLAVELGYESIGRAIIVGSASSSSGGIGTISSSDTVYSLEPLYRLRLSRSVSLDGGLLLGYASTTLAFAASGGSSSGGSSTAGQATGSGLVYMPELKFQFLMGGHVGMDLGVGYRIADFSSLKYTGASASGSSSGSAEVTDSTGAAWHANNGGILIRLGLNIYFGSQK
jgi:hypothetical protein